MADVFDLEQAAWSYQAEILRTTKLPLPARDDLALRVTERTAELQQASERLCAEIERRERLEEELLRVGYMETRGCWPGASHTT